MVNTKTPVAKKKKLISLVKEINRSKEDIIKYLDTIGVDGVSINTSLEPEIVAKVYSHFKKDIEEQDKHLKKVVDFVQRNDIAIYEAEEKLKQEEEEKVKREEEERVRKALEEENRKKEEERKKQEIAAYQEREKAKKEQKEQEKKAPETKQEKERPERKEEQRKPVQQRTDHKPRDKGDQKRPDGRPDKKKKAKFERVTIKDIKPPKKKASPKG